jgi:hypothetical protein
VGVHASQLDDTLCCHDHFVIQNDALRRRRTRQAFRPALVHLLHFGEEREIAAHRRLARQMDAENILLVNPYGEATGHCDSKIRMSEILRQQGIATPAARFISRFTEDKRDAVESVRRQGAERDLYIQPDRGTEATGCVFLRREEPLSKQWWKCSGAQDLIVRERVGNLTWDGHDFVLRMNVTFDGKTFSADSGYCMVGDRVVSAAHGAVKRNINEAFTALRLEPRDIDRIKATACDALRAVSNGSSPPRLAGVDLVLEKRPPLTAYVIDINPRPAAVGSRMIGSNAIGLGHHFWNGIRDLQRTRAPDQDAADTVAEVAKTFG